MVQTKYVLESVKRGLPFSVIRHTPVNVIFNDPATIVYWADGTKTVVKVQNDEPFDKEKGLLAAFMKKLHGNTGYYNEIIKYFCEGDDA